MKKINLLLVIILCTLFSFAQVQSNLINDLSGSKATPSIIVNPFILNFGSVQIGETSAEQVYTLVGANLVGDVMITTDSEFLLTTTSGADYNDTLIITPTFGNAYETIYVTFNPTDVTAYATLIKHESMNATTKNVGVFGTGVDLNAPTIIVNPFMFAFGDVQVNEISMEESYELTASKLTDELMIVAPEGFLVSETSGSGFDDTLYLYPAIKGEISATIYVTFNPIGVSAYAGIITHQSNGATTKNVVVSGNGIDLNAPTITVNPLFLNFNNITVNTTSDILEYMVSATNLTDDIIINAPNGFSVSNDGINFSNTTTLIQTDGMVEQTVFVVFEPTMLQLYSDFILNNSSGVTTNLAVTGFGTDNSVYSVFFYVTGSDGLTPIENAEVIFNGISALTDNLGSATFVDNLAGIYNYSISMNNYETVNNQVVVVNGDVTINESLFPVSAIETVKNRMIIYPNPSNGLFNVNKKDNSTVNVLITDITGKIIMNTVFNNQNFSIDLSNQKAGIYLMTLKSENYVQYSKLVKN